MQRREKKHYIQLLKKLNEMHRELYGCELEPLSIHTDGELAAIRAFEEVYFTAEIKLCTVHFFRAWDSQLEDLMGKTYKTNKIVCTIRTIIRGCVYIEHTEVIRNRLVGFIGDLAKELKGNLKTQMRKYIKYLVTNYFGLKARYPHKWWNYQKDVLNGNNNMSNNAAESQNRQFKTTFNYGHKDFHKAVGGIQKYKSKCRRKYAEKVDGNCLNRVRRKTRIRHQTAAQLLAEFVALPDEKKILYLPNYCIKLALKHPNADTRLPEIATELCTLILK